MIAEVSTCSLLTPPQGTIPCFACVAKHPNNEDYLSRVRLSGVFFMSSEIVF